MIAVSRREICSTSFCFLGCLLLVPSCFMLADLHHSIGISSLVVACMCLVVAASIELYDAYNLLRSAVESVEVEKARRTFHTKLFFFFGAVFFLNASLMQVPFFSPQSVLSITVAELSTWIFRFGSCSYLAANYRCANDVIKNAQAKRIWFIQDVINLVATGAFTLGSVLYLSGGIVGQMKLGAPSLMFDLWVIGSLGFAAGSFIVFQDVIGRACRKALVEIK